MWDKIGSSSSHFVLSKMKPPTEHRKSKSKDIEKKIKDKTPRDLGPEDITVHTRSDAMTVMDKVGRWNEEKCVGSKCAASMWIYTKAVLCDGRGRPPQDLRQMLRIIMECVSWVCEASLWEHEWVTEPKRSLGRKRHLGSIEF